MKEDVSLTLGQKLKIARTKKKLTQKELAGSFITRNMLSQIENDIATPSIKTIEYLANTLEMPVGYFVDPKVRKIPETEVVEEIMTHYDRKNYVYCIDLLDGYFTNHPETKEKPFVKNIYINCCMLAAKEAKAGGDYHLCKSFYDKALLYETDLQFKDSAILYHIYSELSETYGLLHEVADSKTYSDMASYIVKRMVANQSIQTMYIAFVDGDYDTVIEKKGLLDVRTLDHYNQGRFYMMVGTALYYKGDFIEAVKDLELALGYYKNGSYNSVVHMIYENLSRCYSSLEDYEKALAYMQKAQEASI